MIGWGMGSIRLKSGSGLLRMATVTRFGLGMGSVHFGSGDVRFNIRVNVGSGTN